MPCNCDYLEPNRHEIESKKCAENIVFIHNMLSSFCPVWIIEASKHPYGCSSKLNLLVKILCAMCTNMNEKQRNNIIYNAKDKRSRQLADWWEEHQEADKKRIAEEKKEAQIKKTKTNALKKLTKEEKQALKLED